jgi:hypothetical protein
MQQPLLIVTYPFGLHYVIVHAFEAFLATLPPGLAEKTVHPKRTVQLGKN